MCPFSRHHQGKWSRWNTEHGLPRTRGDKRRVVDRALRMKPGWSDRRIATLVDVSHTFVADRRRKMVDAQSGNVATRRDDSVRDGEVVFDIAHECNNLSHTVRTMAGRCDFEDMRTLIHTLHELHGSMERRRKRMAEDDALVPVCIGNANAGVDG